MKKKGFTLIELIAVLVIMAIIALIVTPLVLNIINKAKDSANKRSVDAYGRSIELAIATYMMDNGKYPSSIDELTIEYSGNEVECKTKQINEDGSIYLSECSVDKKEVKDAKEKDGYYHYGKNTSKYDYKVGDKITYNGMEFYVIKNSVEEENYVTLLKVEPLTTDEVNTYGEEHINVYPERSWLQGKAYDYDGYGGMAYYSSETCGYVDGSDIRSGCTNDYDASDIKYVVDAWANDKFKTNDLSKDNLGYKARLITYDELVDSFNYMEVNSSRINIITSMSYEDLMMNNYWYWTMTPYYDSKFSVWFVSQGRLTYNYNPEQGAAVRPVINLKKSAIE